MTRLRIFIATSNAAGNAARITDHLLRALPEVQVVGAVVDLGTAADRSRQRARLAAWRRHGGLSYAAWRLWLSVRPKVSAPPPRPRYSPDLRELGAAHGFPVVDVPNVNHAASAEAISAFGADLGVSLGNRIISERIFTIPPQGMINLHHGAVPGYRGGPPAFWELHDGAEEMGVTVHRIDDRLDHGEVLARAVVPVRADDDTTSLMQRARTVDHQVVAAALADLAAGAPRPIAVDMAGSVARTIPSWSEVRRASRRRGRRLAPDGYMSAGLPPVTGGEG